MRNFGKARKESLLIILLAFAGGATVFYFFLSSRDVKGAQSRLIWEQQIESVLDLISTELMNSSTIVLPFQGNSNQCLYRRTLSTGALSQSLETEGFFIIEGAILHVLYVSPVSHVMKEIAGRVNPLLTGVKMGKFERVGSKSIKILLKVAFPESPEETKIFERSVYLRNK